MKILTTSKCSYTLTYPNGRKENKNIISNIKRNNIVKILKLDFTKSISTQQPISSINSVVCKVLKINCDQRLTFQDRDGKVLEIQLDLLVESTVGGDKFYIASPRVKKVNTPWNQHLKR